MNFQEIIELMESNSFCNIAEMKALLLKIADNILQNPENVMYKMLKKDNVPLSRKIIAMSGGRQMLLLMGFVEGTEYFKFPDGPEYIDQLVKVRQDLGNWEPIKRTPVRMEVEGEVAGPSIPCDTVPDNVTVRPIPLPPLIHKYANPFLRRVTEAFHQALVYQNKQLKENARKRIPVATLERNAIRRMREIQLEIKRGNPVNPKISAQELLLVQLLKWYKDDFFLWVDEPNCEKCGGKTVFSHVNTDEKLMVYTKRVEMYRCIICGHVTPFPRCNDLNILLETRKGRCGEWANVFTLLCHAMGWDARLCVDETDHVWTEVYSPVQKRWVHCDPCDNACDTPLMYEHGWKKSLTYIMAYSPDDLQDVTWRYSSNHKELLKRRRECSETDLVRAIVELRNERIKKLPVARQRYILTRAIAELSELLIERQPKDAELQGRTSGSLDWRIARGEVHEPDWTSTTFGLFDTQLVTLKFGIRYSCSLDKYFTVGEGSSMLERWFKGIFDQTNIMRKVELDWRQVCLCRKAGATDGFITWKVVLRDTDKTISSVFLKMDRKTFEDGQVDIEVSGDSDVCLPLPPENTLTTLDFRGSKTLTIKAHLSGGKGREAWQHAQLFRQPVDSTDFPFELFMTFEAS